MSKCVFNRHINTLVRDVEVERRVDFGLHPLAINCLRFFEVVTRLINSYFFIHFSAMEFAAIKEK